ncbi:MAG: hypothetical protein GWO39_13205, partial [Gammaproteobacteria bacterium]|nr:hypothetical protein [Gammaproteobacteria bacterium]NIR97592.1 hypothetical protein [Gammaproteobacteria bacterium]NIT64682.1 hypothetical protein [Gammaproteobacteria bacterium]NIY33262.1 hypothetical protein [Gammaproteobacteria bacterium]
LPEGANSAGAWLAGAVPHRNAAGEPLAQPGLDVRGMFSEKLKGYLLLGMEPEHDCADAADALRSLR